MSRDGAVLPALISADWGTTSLRLYLLDGAGRIVERRASGDGIMSVPAGGFAALLQRLAADWQGGGRPLPVLLSGMVGSRQGWREAPYVRAPAGLDELAHRLTAVEAPGFASAHIVAGVDTVDRDGVPDVMRGEECQVIGALAATGRTDGRFVLPGTHSKWVEVSGGRITGFRTFMTGEIFAALRSHTILGRMMTPPADTIDETAFARGVDLARRASGPGEWLHRLFSVRTLGLTGGLADHVAADYLSGLMIGWELSAIAAPDGGKFAATACVIGGAELSARYHMAARRCGLDLEIAPQDCVCAGHWRIATAAGLVTPTMVRHAKGDPA